ncbi:MAG: ABC transporter permease, partial [Gemmatimonadetes bacterium]|nr:ABC transporter permease [Gemmatimonadota bacterium]
MSWLRSLLERLAVLLRPGRMDSELSEEMEHHLAMEIEANRRAGMSEAEARRKALVAFGATEWYRERVREGRVTWQLETLARDLRCGLRTLGKRRAFAVAAIVTLGVGIGMTTTMFSVVSSVILRPLPVQNADGLVYLRRYSREVGMSAEPNPQMVQLIREEASSFNRVETLAVTELDLVGDGEPLRVGGVQVSGGFFSFLGVNPALGRIILPGDDAEGSPAVAVLSHRFWVDRFGEDPGVLGRSLRTDDQAYRIVGVLPPEFRLASYLNLPVWIPHTPAVGSQSAGTPVEVLARLADGVSAEAAQAELDAILRRTPLEDAEGLIWEGRVETPRDRIDDNLRTAVLVLQIAAGLVLLIGCGNLANLLLALGEARTRELALRSALGAGRGRLVRQLLVESSLLGILGGGLGLLLTVWSLGVLPSLLPQDLGHLRIDAGVLAFALGVSLLSVLGFGLLPALRGSPHNLAESIKGGRAREAEKGSRFGVRGILVGAEVAMAVVLLLAAGLLAKSFLGLSALDTGFDRTEIVSVSFQLRGDRYADPEVQTPFYADLFGRIQTRFVSQGVPATIASNFISDLAAIYEAPMPEGMESSAEETPRLILTRAVAPDFFRTLGVPLHQGRGFLPGDDAEAEQVVVVNDGLARRYFQGQDPVGSRLRLGEEWYRVVGVAETLRLPALESYGLSELQVYYPFAQSPGVGMTVLTRVAGDRSSTIQLLKEEIWSIDPSIPISRVATADELLA